MTADQSSTFKGTGRLSQSCTVPTAERRFETRMCMCDVHSVALCVIVPALNGQQSNASRNIERI